MIPGIVTALHRDGKLAEIFQASWMSPRLEAMRSALSAGAGGRIDPPRLDLIAEACIGLLLLRAAITHEPIDDEFIDGVIDELITPLIVVDHGDDSASAVRKRTRRQ